MQRLELTSHVSSGRAPLPQDRDRDRELTTSTASTQIAFVGPLPPPVHGFSNVCAAMLQRLQARASVIVFDRTPHPRGGIRNLFKEMRLIFLNAAFSFRHRRATMYIAMSGGRGQLKDLLFMSVARLYAQRIFVHHHSFAYIDHPTLLNRAVLMFTRGAQHIVLSRKMGNALVDAYRLKPAQVRVMSNAALFEPPVVTRARTSGAPIVVGYLSLISEAKGIARFFAVLKYLRLRGVPYIARVAGPVLPECQAVFEMLLAQESNVEYSGPLYGDDKQRFYESLDLLLFPTAYLHEAEPLVIIEAMRQGVYILACARGAIPEMLASGGGEAFAQDCFEEQAASRIQLFHADRDSLQQSQLQAFNQATQLQAFSRTRLDILLADIVCTAP